MRDDPYSESVVITKTVRLLVPFAFVFGLFMMFHGTESVGGGFQGGVVVASVLIVLAFGFGIDQTSAWFDRQLVDVAAVTGVVGFGAVAVASVAFGGTLFEISAFPLKKSAVYAAEAIEVGIGATVAGIIAIMFFGLAGTVGGGADE